VKRLYRKRASIYGAPRCTRRISNSGFFEKLEIEFAKKLEVVSVNYLKPGISLAIIVSQ
jgi:hypothetical protein